jgi:hypothetical protein
VTNPSGRCEVGDEWRVAVRDLGSGAAARIRHEITEWRLTGDDAALFGYAASQREATALAKHISVLANGVGSYIVEFWDEESGRWRDWRQSTDALAARSGPAPPLRTPSEPTPLGEASGSILKKVLDTIFRTPWQ